MLHPFPIPTSLFASHRIPTWKLEKEVGLCAARGGGVMRQMALGEDRRADGRACGQVRPISSRAGLLPSTHGSALFTRGETQTISVVTLGALRTPVIAPCLLQTPCLNHLAQPSGCCTTFSFGVSYFACGGPRCSVVAEVHVCLPCAPRAFYTTASSAGDSMFSSPLLGNVSS